MADEHRTRIIRALAGSSSADPIHIDNLRQRVGAIDDDLEGLLDDLYEDHTINRSSGIKDGKAYHNYWLTGLAVAAAQPFRTLQKMQPNTSTSPIKENNMAKSKPESLREQLLKLITANPGIEREDLFQQARRANADMTETQFRQTIGNLINGSKQVRAEGLRKTRIYFLNDGKPAKAKPKDSTPEKAPPPSPPPARSVKGQHPPKPAPVREAAIPAPVIPQPQGFRNLPKPYAVHGKIKITSGDHSMELDHANAARLIVAIRSQLPLLQRIRLWLF